MTAAEALTSKRPYRAAMTSDDALATIRSEVPKRLDADVFAALEVLLADGPGLSVRPAQLIEDRR